MRDNITLKQLETFWSDLEKLANIGEWKSAVSAFRDAHSLSDIEAIDIANKRF